MKRIHNIMLSVTLVSGAGLSNRITAEEVLTYESLKAHGIVSGFRLTEGDPLKRINGIPSIDKPEYVKVRTGLFPDADLCAGIQDGDIWRFSPLYILNTREIVNHEEGQALCFCPLAGLIVGYGRNMKISGLLKYDAFVLYDPGSEKIVLPYPNQGLDASSGPAVLPTVMLTYAGLLKHYPDAQILDPTRYKGKRGAYKNYKDDERKGIGHAKPGMEHCKLNAQCEGLHPKQRALLVGQGKAEKVYPFEVLNKLFKGKSGTLNDTINGREVTIRYEPEYQYAVAYDAGGKVLNYGYTYIFALAQHLADVPVYHP